MKIAYIHNCPWPSNAPSVSFVTYNALGFAKAGQEFTLYVRDNSRLSTSAILRDTFGIRDIELSIQRIKMPGWLRTNRPLFYMIYKHILREGHFDVLITRHSGFLSYLHKAKQHLLARGIKIITIYEPHDFFYDLSIRSDLTVQQVRKRLKNQAHERQYLHKVDGIIYLQPNLQSYYERYLPNIPGIVAYTGVWKAYKMDGFRDKNKLIYIGSITGEKYSGIFTVTKALELLPKDIALTVIGGRNESEIAAFWNKVSPNLRERIQVTGWIPRGEIERIVLSSGRLAVIPFHQDFFTDTFAYPLKFCDYLGFGLPILRSYSKENPLIQDGIHGLFFKNDDPVDLAKTIMSIWYNEQTLEKMAANVYELAQTRLWENRARTILAFLDSLMAAKPQLR